jgi:hypothetical protein
MRQLLANSKRGRIVKVPRFDIMNWSKRGRIVKVPRLTSLIGDVVGLHKTRQNRKSAAF